MPVQRFSVALRGPAGAVRIGVSLIAVTVISAVSATLLKAVDPPFVDVLTFVPCCPAETPV